jgi:hypothetical protein
MQKTYIVTSAGVVAMQSHDYKPHYGHESYVPKPVLEKIADGALAVFWDGDKATALDPKHEHTVAIVKKAESAVYARGTNGITVNVEHEGRAPEGYTSNDDVTTLLIATGGVAAILGFIIGAAAAGTAEANKVYYVLPTGEAVAA